MAMTEPREGDTTGFPFTEGPKVMMLKSEVDDPNSVTFVIKDEDHTLGNSLRYLLMKNPSITFCGYSLPHPSEFKIHLRIQTNGDLTSAAALELALDQLVELCEHVQESFKEKMHARKYKTDDGVDLDAQLAKMEPVPEPV